MRESSSLHQKVQEMCDCYATNDPLQEMSKMQHETDIDEAAVKWIALAVLHGLNTNAEKLTITASQDGTVAVNAQYRPAELPPPDSAIAERVIQTMRDIIHVEEPEGSSPLAFGIRNNSMDLQVSTKTDQTTKQVSITFP